MEATGSLDQSGINRQRWQAVPIGADVADTEGNRAFRAE
jgi:hypothetical protein